MASARKHKPKRRRAAPAAAAANGAAGPFPQHEREIYEYWDGEKWRLADPLELGRRLRGYAQVDKAFNLQADTDLLETASDMAGLDEARQAAWDRLIAAARYTFEVVPFEDLGDGKTRGLTIAACQDLLWDWSQFVDDLKKKRATSRPSAAATAPPPSAAPCPTPSTAACSPTGGTPTPPSGPPSAPPSPTPSGAPPAPAPPASP